MDEAYQNYMEEEAKMELKIKEETEREMALSKNPEITEYTIQVPLDKTVKAFMAEHDPNSTSNGSWKIDIDVGLFNAYNTTKRFVKPHFAQSGNYYDSKAQIDEFNIDSYFDMEDIYSQGADLGEYPSDYSEKELEEAIEYDLSIVKSARKNIVEMEIYGILTDKLIGKRIYHIEWI